MMTSTIEPPGSGWVQFGASYYKEAKGKLFRWAGDAWVTCLPKSPGRIRAKLAGEHDENE